MRPDKKATLEIKADPKLMRSILRAGEDIKHGELYSHKEVFGKKYTPIANGRSRS
jgi:hypothetical protein